MTIYYNPLGYGSYGWTGMGPAQLSARLTDAGKAVKKLQRKLKFDAVAFSGSSGCAIAFYLAVRYQIPLIYVRKKNEKSHGSKVEINFPDQDIKKYLIVDDFVASGSTVEYIIKTISATAKERDAFPSEPVGVFCFSHHEDAREHLFGKNTLMIYTTRQ